MPASASAPTVAAASSAVIGEKADLTYKYHYMGAGPETLATLVDHPMAKAQKPMFIIGQGALARADGAAVLALAAKARSLDRRGAWRLERLQHPAHRRRTRRRAGCLCFAGRRRPEHARHDPMPQGKGELDVLLLAGADEIDMSALGSAFVVYMGSHGDAGAHRADVILPGAAYTEKTATYVNTEGRPQLALRAAFPPGEAREDWAVIKAAFG
jgi:NADH-quinone oxidoreductase subunit G